MMARLASVICLFPAIAGAESVVAVRTLPAQTVIAAADVMLVDAQIDGALTEIGPAVGMELRTTVYAGRPLRPGDLGTPALVERNQIVSLVYRSGTLVILADGRALSRGAEGDVIRAMNLASKSTVSGRIGPDGRIFVGDLN